MEKYTTNKDIRKKPRWIQQLYAFIFGYFWMPCPICGEYFGGHEDSDEDWYVGRGSGRMVCVNCTEEARKRSDVAYRAEGVTSIDGRKL